MATEQSHRARSAWLGFPAILALIAIATAFKLVLGGSLGLSHDEAYYTIWSTQFSVAYLDHPPGIAYLIGIGRTLFGNTEFAVRALPVLCGALASLAIWRIGILLLSPLTAAIAVLVYSLMPAQGLGFVATPDPPSVVFWVGSLWAVAEFIASRRPAWWLLTGVLAGCGMWSKYTDAFLPIGLFLFLLVDRERRGWLKLWQVWIGAALAIVVFSPLIWWNAQHEWISFLFQGRRTFIDRVDPEFLGQYIWFFTAFVIGLGPILAFAAFTGFLATLLPRVGPSWKALALPAWTSVPAFAYFVFHVLHTEVLPNWTLPLWPSLTLMGAEVIARLWNARPRVTGALIVIQLLIGLSVIGFLAVQFLWQNLNLGRLDRADETRDWPSAVEQIKQIADANGAKWIATSGSYPLASEIATYGMFAGMPLPVRQIDEPTRWMFLPELENIVAGPAVLVSRSRNPPGWFGEARPLGEVVRQNRYGPFQRLHLFLVESPVLVKPADTVE